VVVGDDCKIGANTTIDRGAIEDTVLEEDVRLDNQVQIAHNVRIGAHTAIAGCVGIAGSTRIGRYCMIAGACGIGGHLEICDRVVVTAMSTVLDSIAEPGEYGSGIPARAHGRWKRILVRLGQLDDWARRLRRLENKQT
ncbi:MAG: UDP-3-O-(3-hydroxymyristoyl)glucosamine N-acyltransferase, partial [Wenzhouxiangella sp.]